MGMFIFGIAQVELMVAAFYASERRWGMTVIWVGLFVESLSLALIQLVQ